MRDRLPRVVCARRPDARPRGLDAAGPACVLGGELTSRPACAGRRCGRVRIGTRRRSTRRSGGCGCAKRRRERLLLLVQEDLRIDAPDEALLSCVVDRVSRLAFGVQATYLRFELRVLHVGERRRAGHHGVGRLVAAGDHRVAGEFPAVDEVVHDPGCHVVARGGHVVVAAAEARVDLEEIVCARARINLDVEVGEAGIAHRFEEAARVFHGAGVLAADDRHGVSDARGLLIVC